MGRVTKQIGEAGEIAVISKLQDQGFRLITRNFRIHNIGEIDAVMEKNGIIYVIEVKARLADTYYASPIEAISSAQIRRIQKTTEIFLMKYQLQFRNVEFLAGCVEHNRSGQIIDVRIVPFA